MTMSLSLLKVATCFALFFLLSLSFTVVAMIFLTNSVDRMIGCHTTKTVVSQIAVLFHSLSE